MSEFKFPALNHLPVKGVSPSEVFVGDRFRPADPAGVATLSVSLETDGLMAPIGVRENGNQNANGKYTLVWGLHRLEAAKSLGWAAIDAKIVPAGGEWTPERLQELEALENLARAELSPYDRAVAVIGLRAAMEQAGEKWVKITRFQLAQRIGRSVEGIKDDLELGKNLQLPLAKSARGRDGWLNASVMMSLSKLAVEQQLQLVGWLLANPEGSLKAALGTLAPDAVMSADDKKVTAIKGGFTRLKAGQQPVVLFDLYAGMTDAMQAKFAAMIAGQGNA